MIFVGKENGVVFVGNKLPSDTIGTILMLTPEDAIILRDELNDILIEDGVIEREIEYTLSKCENTAVEIFSELVTRVCVLEDMVEYLYEEQGWNRVLTCIVGAVDNGRVYIGGDSAGVDGGFCLTVRFDRKVFRNGPFVFGFTTSFRMGQILAYNFVPPTIPDKAEDIFRYMCSSFINEVRKSMKDYGYAEVERNVESGGTFLAGVRGRLFKIESDFQVGESSDGFDACGCGSDLALGSMWASRGEVDCRVRILGALEAAERFSAGVRRPFIIIGT